MNHYPITITLNAIRKHDPCQSGWNKLLKYLGKTKGDNDPLLLETILDSNGIDDALWCLCALDQKVWGPNCRMYAVWCAKQVEHLMTDDRSKNALVVAQRHALGMATDTELDTARNDAWAAGAAWGARYAWAAAGAARSSWAAAGAARSAWAAAVDAALDAAGAAAGAAALAAGGERDAQSEMFREMCNGDAPWQVKP